MKERLFTLRAKPGHDIPQDWLDAVTDKLHAVIDKAGPRFQAAKDEILVEYFSMGSVSEDFIVATLRRYGIAHPEDL